MTPDASMIDHRLRTTLNADGLNAYVRASWDLTPDLYTLDRVCSSAERRWSGRYARVARDLARRL